MNTEHDASKLPDRKAERTWSNPKLLKALKNPATKPYRIVMRNPEVTFLGVPEQPDFARVTITMIPGPYIIELKSLKHYFHDFRQRVVSYERFVNVLYDDLCSVYKPASLMVKARFRPRGGISSILTVDSATR